MPGGRGGLVGRVRRELDWRRRGREGERKGEGERGREGEGGRERRKEGEGGKEAG